VSWSLAKLDNHVDILSGFAFKSENFNDRREGLPLVRIRDVVPGVSDTYYSGEYSSEFLLSDGDLLIGMDGDFNRARWSGGQALLNQRVCKITAKSESLDQGYLYHFLPKALDKIHAETPAVTVKHLSVKGIRAIEIPLPPLPEQKRIAAILDKADAIRRKRQQAIQLADDFLRAVFLDMFGDPVTNPKGWMVKKIKDLCMVRGGKRIPKGDSLVKEDTGFPYIKAGNIKSGQVTTKNLEYVPPHVRKVIERYTVDEGDICITVVGANIGDVGVVPKELHKASLTENANKIIIRDGIVLSSRYLSFFLQTDFVQSQIRSKTMAVGVPKLAIFRIEELDLILPPKELQDKFSHIVSAIDGLGKSLESSKSLSKREFLCLNQKAFQGEL